MIRYEKVKKFYLFRETPEPGSKKPDFGNAKVVFENGIPAGRYSFSGWRYEDTGNISVQMERVISDDEPAAESSGGGGFND